MKHCAQISPVDWHVLLCKPNQNHIAFRHLKNLGFDLFMPQHRVKTRWRGRWREEIRPVFAGYMFVAADPGQSRWDRVKRTPGVAQLIGFGQNSPSRVPADLVAGLMSRCDANGLLAPAADDLSIGDAVRVVSGPFYDFVTSVEHIDPDQRLHVLIELMGRPTRLRIDPEMVVKASPNQLSK